MTSLPAIALFVGAGGLLADVDFDLPACETLRANSRSFYSEDNDLFRQEPG